MNRVDIIRMAREAGGQGLATRDFIDLERFAALVAAAERERNTKEFPVQFGSVRAWEDWCKSIRENERESCAKVCDVNKHYFGYQCAEAIRNRGKA